MSGKWVLRLLLLTLAVVGGAHVLYQRLEDWAHTRRNLGTPQVFEVTSGIGLKALAATLEDRGIIDNERLFWMWVRLSKAFPEFKAGNYQFPSKVSPQDIVDLVRAGKIYEPILLKVTIPEGFTLKQVAKRLEANEVGTAQVLHRLATDQEFLSELGVESSSLEGFIYPATYHFYKAKPTPRQALTVMVKKFFDNLPANYAKHAEEMGLSLQEAVTFASLIELETKIDAERPLISEVIWRRLKDKRPLGIDATIIYGIEDYKGDLKWKHLRDRSNLYNTRIHRGLPPTPIGAPSLASIKAVLNPANEGYYYYVLNPDDMTHHLFSKTLKEHEQHVKRLVNATSGRRNKRLSSSKDESK